MSDYEQKDNSCSLFNNAANKTKDNQPDYTGTATIYGKKVRVASWVTESKAGNKYMSLKFSDFDYKDDKGDSRTSTATPIGDLPF